MTHRPAEGGPVHLLVGGLASLFGEINCRAPHRGGPPSPDLPLHWLVAWASLCGATDGWAPRLITSQREATPTCCSTTGRVAWAFLFFFF